MDHPLIAARVCRWVSLYVAPALLTVSCAADPASFLGDMPAWPVNVSCSYFTNPNPTPDELLASVRGGFEAESREQDLGTCTPRPLLVNKMSPPLAYSCGAGLVNIFYNYTGASGSCFNVSTSGPSTLADPGTTVMIVAAQWRATPVIDCRADFVEKGG